MSTFFGGPDTMQMIYDQMRVNPRIEVSNIHTMEWPLTECFENCDMKRMTWDGQDLNHGDTVYWMDQKLCIFKVKIFVEKMDPEESMMATINANIENQLAFRKKQAEAQACNGGCTVPFAKEGV